jgi:hypothetical protein
LRAVSCVWIRFTWRWKSLPFSCVLFGLIL